MLRCKVTCHIALVLSALTLSGCGRGTSVPSALAGHDDQHALVATKLRTYCESCHGLGTLRFIYSDDDQELWDYITTAKVPGSDRLWQAAIVDVLSWPSDTPPPFDELKDPANNKDWMPKGAKRLHFADDTTDQESTRRVMLRVLSE